MLDLLLSRGAEVNVRLASEKTLLMTAVQWAPKHRAQWLLGKTTVSCLLLHAMPGTPYPR
jgi:hypothetical protein